jgi:hypothetical protein
MTSLVLPSNSAPANAPALVAERPQEEDRPSILFLLIVGVAALYLGLRLIQGVIWVVERLG